MKRTLIKNARIIDGSGAPRFPGHLLIEGGTIARVLEAGRQAPPADEVIDAGGLVAAPGFIDMHSHSDWQLCSDDHHAVQKRFAEQGVTTVVGGNCGISPAPVKQGRENRIMGLASIAIDRPVRFRWTAMSGFLDLVDEVGPAMNLVELAGHAAIRCAAAETRRGRMTEDELAACKVEAAKALDDGAAGLSFGLGYDPGMYSPLSELEELFKVAAKAGKPVTVHAKALSRISPCYPVTTPESHNVRALREILELAQKTGARLQVSHFIFVGRRSWPTAERCIEMVERAREQGADVMVDAFPYTCGNTTIHAPLPYWFLARIPDAYKSRAARLRLKAELELGFRLVGFTYKDFQIMDAAVPGREDINGLTIDQVAGRWNSSPFNAMLELARKSRGSALMLFHAYSGEPGNEAVMEAVLKKDFCLFETDAIARAKGYPNPAAVGTFPRILGLYSRDKKAFSLEEAVNRMTGASAERFGITDRGLLKEGMAADVTVFDPALISDVPPEGARPAARPRGVLHVFINGRHAVKGGKWVEGARPGRVIRT